MIYQIHPWTIRKVIAGGLGGGGAKYKKKFTQRKIERKKSCTASSPEKNVLAFGIYIPAREMLTKINRAARKFPTSPPPSP